MIRRLASTLVIALIATACSGDAGSAGALRAAGTDRATRTAAAGHIRARAVVTALDFPAAFTFTEGGRIYYGERFSGWVSVLDPKTGRHHRFFHVPNVSSDGEQGLLGIALAPGYPRTPSVYVYATRNTGSGLRNQIIRIKSASGKGVSMKVIFTSRTEPGAYHDGGHIAFGPDHQLYAVVGESHSAGNAQDLHSTAGKILRMTPSGGIPRGNPFGNRVFAYGIRNSFGFGFDPRNGRLWETENGPECNDELNRIVKGRNYGWGTHQTCSNPPPAPQNTNQDGPSPVLPKRWYSPTIAPTGIAFCGARCDLGPSSVGKLFFGAYNTGELRRVTLTANRLGVARQSVVYTHSSGILSIERSPKGRLFFSDANGIYRLVLR